MRIVCVLARIGLAVALLVYDMVVVHAPVNHVAPVMSNGTAPPCRDDEYLAKRSDNLCHPCDDCVPGQMCTRSGAYAGCHDCAEGLYDNDYEVMTACVDCPEGLTSHLGATSCEKDIWDIVSILGGILGAIGGIGCLFPIAMWCYSNCGGDPSEYERLDCVNRASEES